MIKPALSLQIPRIIFFFVLIRAHQNFFVIAHTECFWIALFDHNASIKVVVFCKIRNAKAAVAKRSVDRKLVTQ